MAISKASVLSNNTMNQQESIVPTTTTTTSSMVLNDHHSSYTTNNQVSGRASVTTLRNFAYTGPTTKPSNSLPNTVRHRSQAFTRGLTSLEPSQLLPIHSNTNINASSSSSNILRSNGGGNGSSSKAVSEPIVFLSLNKLMNKRADDSPLRSNKSNASRTSYQTATATTVGRNKKK